MTARQEKSDGDTQSEVWERDEETDRLGRGGEGEALRERGAGVKFLGRGVTLGGLQARVAPTFSLDPDPHLANYINIPPHQHTHTHFSAAQTEVRQSAKGTWGLKVTAADGWIPSPLFLVGGGGEGKLGKIKTSPSQTVPSSRGLLPCILQSSKNPLSLPFAQHGQPPFQPVDGE